MRDRRNTGKKSFELLNVYGDPYKDDLSITKFDLAPDFWTKFEVLMKNL
jgi:hypothetical protein